MHGESQRGVTSDGLVPTDSPLTTLSKLFGGGGQTI